MSFSVRNNPKLLLFYFFTISSLDTIKELALSPLNIEAFNTAGKGLEKGLSPTLDIIVDKYSDAADSDAPDEHITRIKEGKIAK